MKKAVKIICFIVCGLGILGGCANIFTGNKWAGIGMIVVGLIFGLIAILINQKKAGKITIASNMIKGYSKITMGMSKADVIALFGDPTGQRVKDGIETYTWKNSEFKGFLRGGNIVRSIIVDFENDKVIGFDSENMDKGSW